MTEMDDDPLRCDGCSRESWPDGSLILLVQAEQLAASPSPQVLRTVKTVRVTCGPTCSSGASPVELEGETVVFSFGKIRDVFDYADNVIAAHDWDRGTVQRLSRVLAALHRRRGATSS
jgi:hypothetical protein